jgi:hypothetical protein
MLSLSTGAQARAARAHREALKQQAEKAKRARASKEGEANAARKRSSAMELAQGIGAERIRAWAEEAASRYPAAAAVDGSSADSLAVSRLKSLLGCLEAAFEGVRDRDREHVGLLRSDPLGSARDRPRWPELPREAREELERQLERESGSALTHAFIFALEQLDRIDERDDGLSGLGLRLFCQAAVATHHAPLLAPALCARLRALPPSAPMGVAVWALALQLQAQPDTFRQRGQPLALAASRALSAWLELALGGGGACALREDSPEEHFAFFRGILRLAWSRRELLRVHPLPAAVGARVLPRLASLLGTSARARDLLCPDSDASGGEEETAPSALEALAELLLAPAAEGGEERARAILPAVLSVATGRNVGVLGETLSILERLLLLWPASALEAWRAHHARALPQSSRLLAHLRDRWEPVAACLPRAELLRTLEFFLAENARLLAQKAHEKVRFFATLVVPRFLLATASTLPPRLSLSLPLPLPFSCCLHLVAK